MENMEDTGVDVEMMKEMLLKVVSDMDALESNRILPEGHPKKKMPMAQPEPVAPAMEEMPMEESEELDPAVLDELMKKAGQADNEGALPEDRESDLPPEIAEAVERKRKPVV